MFAARKTDNVSSAANYIEDVFSTWLYTGNGSTQTITNGIDLSTYGGMVWTKGRNYSVAAAIFDTARGANKALRTNSTNGQASPTDALTGFTSSGYTLGADVSDWGVNYSPSYTYASWTFRKQAKFFDVVTYTGNGVSGRQISHNLGSTPGFIIIKRTDTASSWACWHRSLSTTTSYIALNSTNTSFNDTTVYNAAPTSTYFQVGTDAWVNANGGTYVAYLFAHDAGGFGATSSDNVISCGSYTGSGSGGVSVTLGYEPQWVLRKRVDSSDGGNANWLITDIMRGITIGSTDVTLYANLVNSEGGSQNIDVSATGFTSFDTGVGGYNQSGATYIYVAIRRGPMKTPTSGTSVFNTRLRTSNGTNSVITGVGFPPDAIWGKVRSNALARPVISNRLTGTLNALYTDLTNAESGIDAYNSFNMDGFTIGAGSTLNTSPNTYVHHCFKRAPGFFDVVCYTGTGSNRTVTHNLGVAPELMLVKRRDTGNAWAVYANNDNTDYLVLNATDATVDDNTYWNDTSPTASVFSVGTNTAVNASASTYIAYLFATLTGVSKVGSYTGSGTTKQIDCGFTAGARYVFIKRVDSTGDWYVWDSERGIVAGNDPYLLINKLDAEVTNTDYIDPLNAGFEISSTAPAAINANGGTFIFLAIA